MTIPPIKPTNSTFSSYSHSNSFGTEIKEKNIKNITIKWYCEDCHNYFDVPRNNETQECHIPNCPICGSKNIINNRENKGEEGLWMKI